MFVVCGLINHGIGAGNRFLQRSVVLNLIFLLEKGCFIGHRRARMLLLKNRTGLKASLLRSLE